MTLPDRPGDNPRLALSIVTGAFATMLLAANLAAPLYAGYSKRFGFSPAVLALVFAVYALVLMPSLVLFGQVSDRFGRRRVIAAGLGAAIVALVLFSVADSVVWLFAARATQGLAQGMMGGAATAALAELAGRHDARRAALRATLAQSGGSAAGPFVAGMLAQWAPVPYVLPFVVGMLLCGSVAIALRAVPETASAQASGDAWRVRRPSVPREIRGDFVRVALTAAAVWAVAGGLFLSVIPSYAAGLLHTQNLAVLGAIAALMLAASCAAQLVVRRGAPAVPAQAGGLVLLALGLLALVLASPLHAAGLLLAGAVLAGAGHGLAFLAAQDNLTQITPPEQRAAVSASFYVCIYLGVAVPVIGIGILAATVSLFAGIAVFSAVTGTAALVLAVWHLSQRGDRAPGAQVTGA